MSGAFIPCWNSQCVLPPIDLSNPVSDKRSPYTIALPNLISQFGKTQERLNMLEGLLSFRSALHEAGLIRGFQWLDGSFCENVESLRSRPPDDIDVVTFYYPPTDRTMQAIYNGNTHLFDRTFLEGNYRVDGYFVNLSSINPESIVSRSTYWYGVWSHQRGTLLWKGFLQVDLAPTDDHIALDNLKRIRGHGGVS